MPSTELLAELVNRKHEVLLQLRSAGRRQAEIVSSGDTSALLKLLAAKQYLIAALQQVQRELAPFHEEDPDQRAWRTPEDRARCARQADECNDLLAEVIALEKQSTERMAARRQEMADQLRQVHAAGQVRTAYEAQRRRGAVSPPLPISEVKQ
jgi:predicted Zn-dependent protease